MPDEALMLAFARGEEAAFATLLSRHEQPVLRFVSRFVRDPSQAEELTQEVFLRVCKVAERYTAEARFTTWLYTIARNLCIDASRRQKHRPVIAHPSTQDEDDDRSWLDTFSDPSAALASSQTMRHEFRVHLQRALDQLPDEQREVFIMREITGLKFREIADILSISENTVKSRMRYALQSLRDALCAYRDFSLDADEHADVAHALSRR
jgi:RNA polymerase sigma-70 factor, ECF subfamily